MIVEYEVELPSPWVPFPVPYRRLAEMTDAALALRAPPGKKAQPLPRAGLFRAHAEAWGGFSVTARGGAGKLRPAGHRSASQSTRWSRGIQGRGAGPR